MPPHAEFLRERPTLPIKGARRVEKIDDNSWWVLSLPAKKARADVDLKIE
jgi:hypothetical protein